MREKMGWEGVTCTWRCGYKTHSQSSEELGWYMYRERGMSSRTVEHLNKGHLYTEGFDPYLEVVLHWEVFINSHVLQCCGSLQHISMIMT